MQFAAPFIAAQAKTSVTERGGEEWLTLTEALAKGWQQKALGEEAWKEAMEHPTTPKRPRGPAQAARKLHPQTELRAAGWPPRCKLRVNDPSAGSPTETLLRLLLPLNDKV